MPVYRIDLAYDGTGFHGYARQDGQRTIQGELESALRLLYDDLASTAVAGRTDAGVHARGQVVSFDTDHEVDGPQLARSLNGILGPEIAISAATRVEDGFSARFSARFRRYRYQLAQTETVDPLSRNHVWHVGRQLDIAGMHAVAAAVLGEHDFSAFCRSVEGKSNIRHVDEAQWVEEGDLLTFWIKANSFCHQMVRSLVGLAYDVGRGFTRADSIFEIIESGDRGRVVTVAPPHGLTLWEVGY